MMPVERGKHMSTFLNTMITQARSDKQTIVLPEGADPRMIEAAREILRNDIAELVILGDENTIAQSGINVEGARIINPATSTYREEFIEQLVELRKHKGMTPEKAAELISDVLYFGVMMVKSGRADGMVAGACHATGDVLRPCLQILKTAPGVKLVSSFFVMVVPNCPYGENGTFMFSDCGLEVQPDAERLAHIAVNTARSWETLMNSEARVALLSHSTKRVGEKRRCEARSSTPARSPTSSHLRYSSTARCSSTPPSSIPSLRRKRRDPCRRKGERAHLPRYRCGQYRLQACSATREGRSLRPHHPRHRSPGERSLPRLHGRRHRWRRRHHLRSSAGSKKIIGEREIYRFAVRTQGEARPSMRLASPCKHGRSGNSARNRDALRQTTAR